ncbi:polysaccharide deacetylase family protein [Candidatus Woesearchaeota archaeon]|nr:polysaccharide deacetylase family protein [Candidatus Woesearchaeota archaeon]
MAKIILNAAFILLLFILMIILDSIYFYLNCYYGFFSQAGIVRSGSRNKRNVAITFDDGPSKYTDKILDILKNRKVKATFFLVGEQVGQYPHIARRIVEEGHDIGNHSFAHSRLSLRTKKTVMEQIEKAERIIKKITGKKALYFRPPNGNYDQNLREILVRKGYKMVLWTISSYDWMNPGVGIIISKATKRAKNGDIILFHDSGGLIKSHMMGREQTINALPKVIDELKKKRLMPVKISRLLKDNYNSPLGG